MNTITTENKENNQDYGLNIEYLPIVQSMFNRTTAYDACISLSAGELGSVPYETLKPIAEKTDINETLEKWIFEKICKAVKEMIQNKVKFDSISVNVSARYLKSDSYIADLKKILEETDVPPEKLCLEISENDMEADSDVIIDRLHELKREGFVIAIDDYNGNHIPVSRLDSVPADLIKIDKDVTNNIQEDRKSEQITRSIIQRARDLKREAVAKSVINQKHKYLLMALGCDKIQGYISEDLVAAHA